MISGGEKGPGGEMGWPVLGYLLGKNFRRRDRAHLVPPRRMDAAFCRAEVCYPFGRKHGRHRAVKRASSSRYSPYVRPLVPAFFMASSLVAPTPDDSRLNAPETTQPQFQPPATAPFGFLARFKDVELGHDRIRILQNASGSGQRQVSSGN